MTEPGTDRVALLESLARAEQDVIDGHARISEQREIIEAMASPSRELMTARQAFGILLARQVEYVGCYREVLAALAALDALAALSPRGP